MDSREGFYPSILEAACQNALILTVNKRLSRHLGDLFDQYMIGQGRGCWQTPHIYSIEAWLRKFLAAEGEGWLLLGRLPAQRLWEEIIEKDAQSSGVGLLQVPMTARKAMEAHALLIEYETTMADWPLTDDCQAFLRWRELFIERCRKGGWIDPARTVDHVCQAVADHPSLIPQKVLLAGFDEMTPRLEKLKKAFSSLGCHVEEVPPVTEPQGRLSRMSCADAREEVRRAAGWSRSLLEKGKDSIGIVVPELERYRNFIEQIFREEIDPSSQIDMAGEKAHFSLSLGFPFIDQGLVTAAFKILQAGHRVPLDLAGFLLRSPYLKGSQTEAFPRAQLDKKLRSLRSEDFTISSLEKLAAKGQGNHTPLWLEIISSLKANLAASHKKSPGEWAAHFSEVLRGVGWPGERPLSSVEYQTYKVWLEKLLPALVSLDAVCPSLERGEALALLRRLASEIVFQPEGQKSAVQVLGLLEAAGLGFDHLWVMGMTENALPAAHRPNPFLPVQLQVKCGMPHASAAKELDFAQKVICRLFASAPSVVLSHPCREGDCELRPSPFIRNLPEVESPLFAENNPVALIRDTQNVLEHLTDEQGPPLASGEKAFGGISLLKDQALCPFRAFVRHRLAARSLDSPEIGLDAGARGTLVHSVLENFWAKTRDHQGLMGLSEEELARRVEECVDSAVDDYFEKGVVQPPDSFLKIERKRLAGLVAEWLREVERNRPYFAVDELEKSHRETIGKLVIDTKVDRIDRLEDGQRVILDYKTGNTVADDLIGDRLLEPQLPVYGTGEAGASLAALAFAIVRRGECTLKGVAREDNLLPKVKGFEGPKDAEKPGAGDWAGLLEHWRRQLEELADEFVQGRAVVDPVNTQKACRYCDLAGLCRIGEWQQIGEVEE